MNFDGYKQLTGGEFDTPWPDDIVMSQSRMKNMMYSPSREGLARIADFRPQPSEAMWFGTVVHAAIDGFLNNELELMSLGWMQRLAANPPHPDDEGFDLLSVFSEQTVAAMIGEAELAFDAWLDYWWLSEGENLDLIQSEQRLHRQLGTLPDGRRVFIAGTPDYVAYKFGVPTGFDWKTSNGPYSFAKAASSPQAPLLTWLLERTVHTLNMDWEFIVWDRKSATWDTWALDGDYAMSDQYVESVLMNAWQFARCIAYEAYPAITMVTAGFSKQVRPWYAKPDFDPWWDINPFRFYLDDIEEGL
jgi:hypothetical protein